MLSEASVFTLIIWGFRSVDLMKKWMQIAIIFILTLSLLAPAAVQAEGQPEVTTTTEVKNETLEIENETELQEEETSPVEMADVLEQVNVQIATEIMVNKQNITLGEKLEVTVKEKDSQQPVADAVILIDGQVSKYTTDVNGQVTIDLAIIGEYKISAEKYTDLLNENIIYTEPITIVVTSAPSSDIVSEIDGVIGDASEYLLAQYPTPGFWREWVILALARSNNSIPKSYFETYYNNVVDKLEQNNGTLTGSNTEYSRLIIALTAIGKDPRDVGGYNLLEQMADYDKVIAQGVNGAIFALIALDTYGYEIPNVENIKNINTREKLVNHILEKEINGGGFSLGSNPDPDVTAMAIQALIPYKGRADVNNAIERAVAKLQGLQKENGGYDSWGFENVQSPAQVLVALSAMGIDANTDSRFLKNNGAGIIPAMMNFYDDKSGAFKQGNRIDPMATEQAMHGLVAYKRFKEGKTSLYDMTDVEFEGDSGGGIIPPTDPDGGNGGTVPPTNPDDGIKPPTETNKNVNLSITISSSEVLLSATEIEVKENETVFDVLERATSKYGIQLNTRETGYGVYVVGIGGVSEFDRGPLSGWMYRVNGVFENISADNFNVNAGDIIEWLYTSDLGEDIGGGVEEDGSNKPKPDETPEEKPDETPEVKPGETPDKEPNISIDNDGKDIVVMGETKDGNTKVTISAATVKAKLQNQTTEKLVVTDGKSVRIEIPKAMVDPAKLALKGDDYNLVISAKQEEVNGQPTIDIKIEVQMSDGKTKAIKASKDYIKVTITADDIAKDAVLLQLVDGNYQAVPHRIIDGQIVFQTKMNGIFVVSTKSVSFNDINKVFNKDEIEFLAKRHVVTGREDGSFAPNESVTRGQFAAIIARALGLQAEYETQFSDTKGKWYADYVQALYEAGITKGTSVDTFNPEAKITRQQAAAFATRILDYVNYQTKDVEAANFKDQADISKEFQDSVALVKALDIMSGKENGNFDPKGNLTRAQLVKVVKRTLVIAEMF